MAKRILSCNSCGFVDEASYFKAQMGDCPACGEEGTQEVRKKQETFDRLRCSVEALTEWKKNN